MKHRLHASFLLLAAAALAAPAGAQYTTVSKSTGGAIADQDCYDQQMSGDGRFVVFSTRASTLVAGDANGFHDVYLRDVLLGTTERISQGLAGAEPDGDSRWPAVSDDGRWVVFGSGATNLVAGDVNGDWDAFRHDRLTGSTVLCSLTWLGAQTTLDSAVGAHSIDVSDDGRYVVFESNDNTLVPISTLGAARDVFLRDVTAAETHLVSYEPGAAASSGGWRPSITADGALVVFVSGDVMHADDVNLTDDVYGWHRGSGTIELISKTAAGTSGASPGRCDESRVSPDGRYVVFQSTCTDLDAADPHADRDAYLRDRTAGTTEVVSLHWDGSAGPYSDCFDPDVSADGRYVVFHANHELTRVEHSPFHFYFVYLRDRVRGTTEYVSVPRWWWPGAVAGGGGAYVSDDGALVLFQDAATYQESPSSIHRPLVQRRRDGVTNLMSLSTSDSYWTGMSMTLTAWDAAPFAPFWVLRSAKSTGFVYQGHHFDLGAPITMMGGGTSNAAGKCAWTSAPLPTAASGRTIQLEIASKSGGVWKDSNRVEVDVH